MTAHPLADISVLDQFAAAPVAPGYPLDRRTLFSPVDQVHGALVYLIGAATTSLDVAMYALDDPGLVGALIAQMQNPNVAVRLTLDSSQADGMHEKLLLTTPGIVSTDISVGTSERGDLMHLKAGVIDGTVLFTGSTNFSTSAEESQDNQLTVAISPAECAQLSARISVIHTFQQAHQRKEAP